MNDKTKVGLIGLGPMGRDLLKQANDNPKSDVVAICDIDPDAIREASSIVSGDVEKFSNYLDMITECKLDGVIVAVPQYAHHDITIDCLDNHINVFCEKPMALSVKQCAAMINAAHRSGCILMIGQVLRYITVYRYVLELATSGEFGKPIAMRTIRSMGYWGRSGWAKPWRLRRSTSGGMLFEVNIHEIDLMLCILGQATSVTASGNKFANTEVDYEDFITAEITFASGAIGSVTSSCCDFVGRNSGEVYLEEGSIYYDSLSSEVRVGKPNGEKDVIPYSEIGKDWEGGVYREVREFIEACRGEQPVSIPGEDGMRAVEIAEAAYLSAATRRRIELPLPVG